MNKNRLSIILPILLLALFCPALTQAQENPRVSIGMNNSYHPDFRLIDTTYPHRSSHTIRLTYHDRDYHAFEYGGHFRWGYHQDVSFSYGFSTAYVLPLQGSIQVKSGLAFDKFKLDETLGEFFIGGYLDGNKHESVKLYLETEKYLFDPVSLYLQLGYRFFRSQVEVITETGTETNESGQEIPYTESEVRQMYYGSGFNIGLGMKLEFGK